MESSAFADSHIDEVVSSINRMDNLKFLENIKIRKIRRVLDESFDRISEIKSMTFAYKIENLE